MHNSWSHSRSVKSRLKNTFVFTWSVGKRLIENVSPRDSSFKSTEVRQQFIHYPLSRSLASSESLSLGVAYCLIQMFRRRCVTRFYCTSPRSRWISWNSVQHDHDVPAISIHLDVLDISVCHFSHAETLKLGVHQPEIWRLLSVLMSSFWPAKQRSTQSVTHVRRESATRERYFKPKWHGSDGWCNHWT